MTTASIPGAAISGLELQLFGTADPAVAPGMAAAMILAMLDVGDGVSDLIFSPGRPPQVEKHGELTGVQISAIPMLKPEHTAQIARELIAGGEQALRALYEHGAADFSYSIPNCARFRVNVFRQRSTYAIVMRVIAQKIPSLAELQLPQALTDLAALKNGLVLVTGPTGSGKSSTLAAVIDQINSTRAEHILTIEDPIEFLHLHKKATLHQRELHSDTPTFSLALRAALRQAPKVILVGEMRDKETIEIAMEAAETGHLVFSTLHTIDASKTVERIIGVFPLSEQHVIRNRLSRSFRWIVSQRLIPRKDGSGRIAAFELLKSTQRTREYMDKGESEGKSLTDAMRDGNMDGMQCFDQVLEEMIRKSVVDFETGIAYATNPGNLRLELSDMEQEKEPGAVLPKSVTAPRTAARQEKHQPTEPELIIE